MPSIIDLLSGLPTFNYYYGGQGNFTLNKIPFGKDRPGGGSSPEPYIVRKQGETWSPTSFDDGVIRFGAAGVVERTTADIVRITKFFADGPKGPAFLAKQVGLQLSNPMPEMRAGTPTQPQGTSIFDRISGLPSQIKNDIGTTRIYNLGLNTLAQVGVAAVGGHFYRHGLSPVMDDHDKYISVVADNNNFVNEAVSIGAGNRLVRLTAEMFDSFNTNVLTYKGGAGSVYGVGTTTIKRSVDTLGTSSPLTDINTFVPLQVADLAKISRDGILIQTSGPNQSNPNNPSNATLTSNATVDPSGNVSFDFKNMDFRQIKNALYNTNLPFSDYVNLNMSTRIGRGRPGTPGLDRSKYWQPLEGTQDTINMLSLFYSANPPQTDSDIVDLNSGAPVTPASVRDIVKFRLEAMDNDNPAFSVWIVNRAFIMGDIDDSFSEEWNSYKYTGRGERFYVYDGYVRTINFTFAIAAQTRQEMKPLYQKLNYLMSTMAPDYNSANKMRGNIMKLTLGDYIYRQPGIITGLNVRIPAEAPWEIAIDEPEGGNDQDMHEVPMLLYVSVAFTPIQSFLPRKGASVPWISVRDRKSPTNTTSPSKNDWLADNGVSNNDSGPKYISLDKKIKAAQQAASS